MSGAASGPVDPIVLLDACCLLNFCAAGCCEAIAETLGCSFVIAEAVSKEALYTRREPSVEDPRDREAVDLAPLVRTGVIAIVALDEAELETFLAFASQVDNGEAATCALAIHRGLPLATDDRKARRLLLQQALPLQLYSTLDLLKLWAETCKLGAGDLALTLMAVRDRGSFVPPRGDPLRGWWETSISAAPIEEF